jgi:hypothetical protein
MPCGPRMLDDELRASARARISDGRLPLMSVHPVIAGYGSGAACHLCGHPIEQHQVEYEVSDARNDRSLLFLVTCHAAWHIECRSRQPCPPETAEHP